MLVGYVITSSDTYCTLAFEHGPSSRVSNGGADALSSVDGYNKSNGALSHKKRADEICALFTLANRNRLLIHANNMEG